VQHTAKKVQVQRKFRKIKFGSTNGNLGQNCCKNRFGLHWVRFHSFWLRLVFMTARAMVEAAGGGGDDDRYEIYSGQASIFAKTGLLH
jgi:hypothetical protein